MRALLAAGLAAVPVPIVQTGFLTPSGNIACNAGPAPGSNRALLACTLFSAASTARGQKLWSMYATGGVRVGFIVGNASTELPRLAYGRTWRWRGLACSSAATGLTCRNTAGHGFFLSRERQRVF